MPMKLPSTRTPEVPASSIESCAWKPVAVEDEPLPAITFPVPEAVPPTVSPVEPPWMRMPSLVFPKAAVADAFKPTMFPRNKLFWPAESSSPTWVFPEMMFAAEELVPPIVLSWIPL